MTSLPPYSTFRTDAKQMMFPQATSHGNILTFTPPGFKQTLSVKFPDSRLAVCDGCKKNFKTRDMCRVRNTHTAPPWTTAYVCITVDSSCTDDQGKYIDRPMTLRMVQWQPYAVRKPFDSKTPVCAGCKRTNRTRGFCRDRHKHRQLPWCTVYVLLSALDQADPSTVVAGASKPTEDSEDGDNESGIDFPGGQNGQKRSADSPPPNSTDTITSDADDSGDDINDIAESRTFLAKVSSRGSSIHWLDLLDQDDNGQPQQPPPQAAAAPYINPAEASFAIPMPTQVLDPSQYYAHAHYAQQHQNALKSHQQYFFQMQQRQQQMTQWQQQQQQQQQHAQYAQSLGGQQQPLPLPPPPQQQQQQPGDASATSGSGSTEEAAPSSPQQQREGGSASAAPATQEVASPPPAQQWHMYYPPPQAYAALTAPTGEAVMNGGANDATNPQQQQQQHQQHTIQMTHHIHHQQPEGAEDEPDAKRQRSSD